MTRPCATARNSSMLAGRSSSSGASFPGSVSALCDAYHSRSLPPLIAMFRGSPADDVPALSGVPVASGDVPPTVGDAACSFDSEIGVAHRSVAGQPRGTASHVEAVVSRAHGDVALQEAAVVFPIDQEPIVAARSDHISANDVFDAAKRRRLDSEADTRPAS